MDRQRGGEVGWVWVGRAEGSGVEGMGLRVAGGGGGSI